VSRWFRLTFPARGRKIVSRRRVRVWLKQCEAIMHREVPTPDDAIKLVFDSARRG
jgi:hypothetical protein